MIMSFYFIFFITTRPSSYYHFFFFFNDTATTEIYTLSLHDALPILDRADVDLGRCELLHRRVQRRRLAGARRAGDEDDAVGLADHFVPTRVVFGSKAQLLKIANQHLGREDPHHDLLAESGRHGRDAQLDLLALRRYGLDPPVLRPPLLDDFHAREQLDAARHREQHRIGDRVDLMQHAVDAETHDPGVATRLDVDVGRALLERVLPQPVDDVYYVLIVGIE